MGNPYELVMVFESKKEKCKARIATGRRPYIYFIYTYVCMYVCIFCRETRHVGSPAANPDKHGKQNFEVWKFLEQLKDYRFVGCDCPSQPVIF